MLKQIGGVKMSNRNDTNNSCGDLFSCGDPITVRYPSGDEDAGIFIGTEGNQLIWRNIDEGNALECVSCVGLSIRERIPV
jgi:hypothetical protein